MRPIATDDPVASCVSVSLSRDCAVHNRLNEVMFGPSRDQMHIETKGVCPDQSRPYEMRWPGQDSGSQAVGEVRAWRGTGRVVWGVGCAPH